MFLRPLLPLLVLSPVLSFFCDNAVAGDGLSPQQQQLFAAVVKQFEQAQTNWKLAEESAGPAGTQPKGSKARLAMMRLGSARSSALAVNKALAGLPADNAEVAKLRGQVTEIEHALAALETRITGAAPVPGGSKEPTGVKLDYKQEKVLKDAQFYLREVTGLADSLGQLVEQIDGVAEKDTINHLIIAQAMATIDKARQRSKLVTEGLATLPADGRGVATTKQQSEQVMARVESADKTLQPLNTRLQELINPANYPQLQSDLERLGELTQMFRDPSLLTNEPERVIPAVTQTAAARAELIRVLKAYDLLIRQETEAGKRVKGSTAYLAEKLELFNKAAAEAAQALPGRIQADIAEVLQIADEAVREQKPLFFTGGIPQTLGFAESKLLLLEALDPAAGKVAAEQLAQCRLRLKEQQAGLRDQIIASNAPPADNYQGSDKSSLIETAIETWKKVEPGAEVVAVHFPSQAWDRQTMWRLQNTTWYRTDSSHLQAQLLVKHDDKLAVMRPVNLYINHMKGESLTASPLDGIQDELLPQRFLPLEKIR